MDARTLHDSLFIVDGHADTVLDLVGHSYSNPNGPARDFFARGSFGYIDLPRLIEGNVGCQIFALFVDDPYVREAHEHTWHLLETMEGVFAQAEGRIVLARDIGELRAAHAAGKPAAMLSIEGGEALGFDPMRGLVELRAFYDRGVRLMGLTWNRRNALGRGAGTGTPADGTGGLTDFGKTVVREMESLGMVVDASHLSDEALDDLVAIAERPIVASHSNSRTLVPNRRNLSDAQAEAIAESGGLIGVTFAGVFVDPDPAKVTKERVFEHLEHLISVTGVEHVGLGSDFDGFTAGYGVAFTSPAELRWITATLLEKGYSKEDIALIMGGNWLRVIGEVCG